MWQVPARVCVIDDDPAVGEAIMWTLTSVGYTVETYPEANQFLTRVRDSAPVEPFAAVIDMLLPGMTGLTLFSEIAKLEIPCGCVVISGHADVASAVQVMRLGAVDVLEKPFSRPQLLAVVGQALDIARDYQRRQQEEADAARRLASLSRREREVFDDVVAGLVTKEIAKHIGISARTVEVHRSRMMQKLEISSPLQLGRLIGVLTRGNRYVAASKGA